MPPSASSWLCLVTALHASRRIDGGELILERSAVLLRKLLDAPDRAQRTHGRTEQGDAGEKEERFLFGWGRHAPMVSLHGASRASKLSLGGPKMTGPGDRPLPTP